MARTVSLESKVFASAGIKVNPDNDTSAGADLLTITGGHIDAQGPFSSHVNFIENRQDALLNLIEKHGILPWSDLTAYENGALCKVNRTFYQLVEGGDGTQDPSTDDGSNWEEFTSGGGAGFIDVETEEITLALDQTEVSLTNASTTNMELYIEGAREFDFTVTGQKTFELPESFPAGTRIWVVSAEVYADSENIIVESTTGTSRTLKGWVGGVQYTYDTLADAQADEVITVGARVVVLGDHVAFDGGGCKLDVVASGGEIALTASGLTANRVDARLISRASVEALLQVDTNNGRAVHIDAYHGSYPSKELLGGGTFQFKGDVAKSNHNGGTIISATVPWDWSDDGASFLSATGETNPSGFGCWVRTNCLPLTPTLFGAKCDGAPKNTLRDSASDDTAPLQAAVDTWVGSEEYTTLDLAGRVYCINDSIVSPAASAGNAFMNAKRLTNGVIQVKSTYTGGPILDFTPITVSRRSRFDNLWIYGGIGGQGSEAEGGIHFADVSGMVVADCEMRWINGSYIKITGTGAAGETLISGNRLVGGYGGTSDANSLGIECDKGDVEIIGNVVETMSVAQVYLRAGAVALYNNHLWGEDGDVKIVPNIVSTNADSTIIVGNYIDNGPVRMKRDAGAPRNLIINNNKFVCNAQSAPEWIAASLERGFIEFEAGISGVSMRGISVQGNSFLTPFNDEDVLAIQCWTPAMFTSSLRDVYIKDNIYDDNMTIITSHPQKIVSFSATQDVEVDMNDLTDGIRRLPGPWNVKHPTSSLYISASGTQNIRRVSRSGDVFTVHLSGNATGEIILSATCNDDGA